MKTTKRILAVLLSVCMLLSAAVISVSAEDATPKNVSIRIISANAAKVKDGDPQTVLQLQLSIYELVPDTENTYRPASFNKVDTNAEIPIYEGVYITVDELLSQILGKGSGEYDEALIAKAKPVSISNGILTVDVYAKNGAQGAKMVAIELDGFNETAISNFYFDIPYGIFSNDAGTVNNGICMSTNVSGLQSVTLEMPSLVKSIVTAFAGGDIAGLLGKAIFILPFAFIIVPIVLGKLEKNAQKIYDLYSISVKRLFSDAQKAVYKLIPYLLGSIF